jgi:hypothetical protein
VLGGQVVVEVAEQLGELLGEVVGRGLAAVALQREHGHRIRAGRTADAQVDPPGVERAEHAEGLGHLQRAVVGQHHATAPDPRARRARRDLGDQHLGRRAREHRAAVVLGDPVAVVAELVRQLGEVERVAQRVGAGRPLRDRRLIQHAQPQCHPR